MASIAPEQLLAEIEDVIRTMPSRETIHQDSPEILSWMGRASAVIHVWDPVRAVTFNRHITDVHAPMANDSYRGLLGMIKMLHQAGH